jgi:E3 ubiquitin-protein ligase MARCH6
MLTLNQITRVSDLTVHLKDYASRVFSSAEPEAPPKPDTVTSKAIARAVEVAEPHFARFGKHVRLSVEHFREQWINMTVGSGPAEKVFAISLGYVVVGLAVAVYLNLLTVGNAKSANRAIRSAVKQQLLVIKVGRIGHLELQRLICYRWQHLFSSS